MSLTILSWTKPTWFGLIGWTWILAQTSGLGHDQANAKRKRAGGSNTGKQASPGGWCPSQENADGNEVGVIASRDRQGSSWQR